MACRQGPRTGPPFPSIVVGNSRSAWGPPIEACLHRRCRRSANALVRTDDIQEIANGLYRISSPVTLPYGDGFSFISKLSSTTNRCCFQTALRKYHASCWSAASQPTTSACMHFSAWQDDGATLLRALSDGLAQGRSTRNLPTHRSFHRRLMRELKATGKRSQSQGCCSVPVPGGQPRITFASSRAGSERQHFDSSVAILSPNRRTLNRLYDELPLITPLWLGLSTQMLHLALARLAVAGTTIIDRGIDGIISAASARPAGRPHHGCAR